MRENEAISLLRRHIDVSRETIERLVIYEKLLKKWNKTINLVSPQTLNEIWTRHFLDSAQIWQLRPQAAQSWLDLGSGGGFPGLVIAVLAAETAPQMPVGLVESDARKSAFLLQAGVAMGISPKIHVERAEYLAPQAADVVSARALAPLDKLLGYSARHLKMGGCCLFSKGESVETELTEARKYWTFEVQKTPSLTDSGGVILRIGDLGRV